jgi:transketolase
MENKLKTILDISRKLNLSHIGSNISCLPVLQEIYKKKKPEDKVILDGAHAHLAHLLVYATNLGVPPDADMGYAEDMIKKYGIHCDKRAGCDASGGSLGHGLGISIGYALANPKINVYCIVTDGSMMEGSNWEALRLITDFKLANIHIYCNFNGYSAVAKINLEKLVARMRQFTPVKVYYTDNTKRFEGIKGHYMKI